MKVSAKLLTCFLAIFIVYSSCKTKTSTPALFELMNNTGVNFQNKAEDNESDNCLLYRNFYNGGGVAVGDLNNDGFADIIFTSNMGNNAVYLNKGNLPAAVSAGGQRQAGFKFEDITATSGLRQDNQWCTGVTLADVNSDGWLDIYICSSGHISNGNRKNKLYINNHNLTFTEAAAQYGLDYSGYCTQATFFDYDMDGDLDCFIINNTPIPFSSLNYAHMRDVPENEWKVGENYKGGGNHLFRNDNGHFIEVTEQAGIHTSLISFGLGVSVGDINQDGYPDIYVGNDFIERDYLYINQKNGTFKDELEDCMAHTSMSSMSSDLGDINNDGYPDIYTTDMLPWDDYRLKTTGVFDNIDLYRSKIKAGFYYQYVKNCLQLNNGGGKFSEIGNYSGVSATDWSWGGLIFDGDNDGWNDIYVCNGINRDLSNLDFLDFFSNNVYQKMQQTGKRENVQELLKKIPRTPLPNKVFKNMGNLQFADIGESWGFTQPSFSNSVAYGDLDNDGDLDLVVNNENETAFVYKNNSRETNSNHYISILLRGDAKNTFAVGSKISIYIGKEILTREVVPTRGFQSSVDYKQVVGIGAAKKIDSLVIAWPNRTTLFFSNPEIDTLHIIRQPSNAKRIFDTASNANPTLFSLVKTSFDRHIEDDYVDFYSERNIPQMLSREGPRAATGDVNGDGLEDIFICGAKNQAGQLYLQNIDGKFIKKNEKDFDRYADFEDVATLFFDCDGDGDPDLFIGSGGNTVTQSGRELQHRLYKNDGKGNFSIDVNAFPSNADNASVAVDYDFDNDGDPDLFVGALNVTGNYGLTPMSHIYINDGKGHFSNMDKDEMGGIDKAGMVTGVAWADVYGDNRKELILVGDWMYPRVFAFNKDHFEEIKTNLQDMYGWWQTLSTTDLNNDGKIDLVLGNVGENFYLHPDKENPVKLWLNDFDQNGSMDKIVTRTVNGKDMPVFLKHDMEEQIPLIKKQSLRHEEYAGRSIRDLFPPELINNCFVKQFNYTSSCIAINNGNGDFTVKKLPAQVQFSSVNTIMDLDINHDGFTDLVTGGNQFNFVPQLQKLDASFGDVLLNDGKARLPASANTSGDRDVNDAVGQGNFKCINSARSGLLSEGEVRDIKVIKAKNEKYLLFLRNDDFPALYKINDQ